jgi:hypothetical protein
LAPTSLHSSLLGVSIVGKTLQDDIQWYGNVTFRGGNVLVGSAAETRSSWNKKFVHHQN